jgi:hypothetical protein
LFGAHFEVISIADPAVIDRSIDDVSIFGGSPPGDPQDGPPVRADRTHARRSSNR